MPSCDLRFILHFTLSISLIVSSTVYCHCYCVLLHSTRLPFKRLWKKSHDQMQHKTHLIIIMLYNFIVCQKVRCKTTEKMTHGASNCWGKDLLYDSFSILITSFSPVLALPCNFIASKVSVLLAACALCLLWLYVCPRLNRIFLYYNRLFYDCARFVLHRRSYPLCLLSPVHVCHVSRSLSVCFSSQFSLFFKHIHRLISCCLSRYSQSPCISYVTSYFE